MTARFQRIVTLLPSATEIVCALGLRDQLVGITHECDYPASVNCLPRVTTSAIPRGLDSQTIDSFVREQLQTQEALYSIDVDLLTSLQPDLVITQALCDVCAVSDTEVRAALNRIHPEPALINLEPMSLEEVFDTILVVGQVAEIEEAAHDYVDSLKTRVACVAAKGAAISLEKRPGVAFLEWIDPPFNAGHWNPELIELAGGIDCLGNKHEPSRTITYDEINAANPDILVIALCGFNIKRATRDLPILRSKLDWQNLNCVKNSEVHVLDGNAYFSRSGPRLVDSLEMLSDIILNRK